MCFWDFDKAIRLASDSKSDFLSIPSLSFHHQKGGIADEESAIIIASGGAPAVGNHRSLVPDERHQVGNVCRWFLGLQGARQPDCLAQP